MAIEKTVRRRGCPWTIKELVSGEFRGQFRGYMTLTLLASTQKEIEDAFNKVKSIFDTDLPSRSAPAPAEVRSDSSYDPAATEDIVDPPI